MRGRAAAVALPALVVGALVAVVAIASAGSTPGGSSATRSPSETLYDVLFTLGLVAVALGGVLLVYGLMQRRAIQREIASGRYGRTSLVGWVVFVMLFTGVFYLGLVKLPQRIQEGEAEAEPAFPTTPQLPALPEGAETSYTPSVSWIPLLVVAGLLVAGITAYVLSERRARRSRTPGDGPLASQLAAVLDDTLDDLRAEADPRRAIIAAYARLERVLSANGIARRPAETSDEYLDRVLHDLELSPDAIGRLTKLFTRAKFSQHSVDLTMKEEAISALEDVRDELRLDRDRPVAGAEPAPVGAVS